MFAPNAWSGNYGRRDLKYGAEDGGGLKYEYQALKKFFKKYPEMAAMPLLGPIQNTKDGGIVESHPAHQFLQKTKKLVKAGYTEEKAMDIVGVEIDEIIQKQKDEQRILRGVALDTQAYSYVDRFQQVAEIESQMKMKRMERDMPKFLRAQRTYMNKFDNEISRVRRDAEERVGM